MARGLWGPWGPRPSFSSQTNIRKKLEGNQGENLGENRGSRLEGGTDQDNAKGLQLDAGSGIIEEHPHEQPQTNITTESSNPSKSQVASGISPGAVTNYLQGKTFCQQRETIPLPNNESNERLSHKSQTTTINPSSIQ